MISYLRYPLAEGYVHHWLAAGPLEVSIPPSASRADFTRQLIRQFPVAAPGVTESPVDLGPVDGSYPQDPHNTWRYYRCREDHLVDFTRSYPVRAGLAAYAYVNLHSPIEKEVTLQWTTTGLADLWFNGQHTFRQGTPGEQARLSASFPVVLHSSDNEILVRLVTIGERETRHLLALHLSGEDLTGIKVTLPTEIEAEYLEKRAALERIVESAYLDRYVYGYLEGDRYNRNEPVSLHFSKHLDTSDEITFRIQSPAGNIFEEGTKIVGPAAEAELARTYPLRSGPHHLALLSPAGLYYLKNLQFERKELLYVVRSPFSLKVPKTYAARKQEALQDTAQRRSDSLFCEIAKMKIHSWDHIDRKILQAALLRIQHRWDGSVSDLLGFLGMLMRFGKRRSFFKELEPSIVEAISTYRYWKDEPGEDGMDFDTESRQILFHASEILAGQLLPDQVFSNSGQPGSWHRKHGEQMALAWMRQRGMFGFREWDSPSGVEASVLALTHLIDLAKSELGK